MHKSCATNLLDISKEEAHKWLENIFTVITDCDGVLWHDNVAIPGSPEVINALKSSGKHVYFCTNNGTRTRREIWQRAHALGYNVAENDIWAPSHSIAQYLRQLNFQKKVYVIGSTAIGRELDAVGIEHFGAGPDILVGGLPDYLQCEIVPNVEHRHEVGAVVVGFDEHFSYGKLLKACNYLGHNENCLFLCTNVDPVHNYPQYKIPGTGALLRALETCVRREAMQVSKPKPAEFEKLIGTSVVVPEHTLMIGDCCHMDVAFGKNFGFQTLLVGSGNTKFDEVQAMLLQPEDNALCIPDFYLPSLGDLQAFL